MKMEDNFGWLFTNLYVNNLVMLRRTRNIINIF
jgi:hypothetical protein